MSDVTSHQNSARGSAYPRETTMAPDWDGPIALRPGPDGVRPERPVGRVRVRMLDQEGRPVGGAQARVALIKDGAPRIERIVTAGPTGYVATDFAERAGEATRIEITPMVGGKLREEATRRIDPGQGAGTVLRLPDGVPELVGPSHADLAGFLTPPDLGDAEFAPELFHPSVIERDGTCALDFNASVELREFHFRQLIREDTPSFDGYARDAVDEPIPFDWSPDEEGELRQPQEPVFGRLCLYRQSWSRVGHGLGQLLHSLALAPCEETRIAMIEWSRDESGVRAASARTRENLTHVQFRDRVIDEIVSGAVDESQSGSSSSAQAGAGITGSAGSSGFSLGGSAATAQSASTGHRNLTGRTIQTLSDAVKQHSTAVRSARSTVVMQSDQGERDNIRTRIVRNHNRNHAMTVEYFQVVEHYSVQTELLRQEPVVMLPYAVPKLLWNRFPAFETVSPMGEIADLKRGLLDVASRAAADLGFTSTLTVIMLGEESEEEEGAVADFVERGIRVIPGVSVPDSSGGTEDRRVDQTIEVESAIARSVERAILGALSEMTSTVRAGARLKEEGAAIAAHAWALYREAVVAPVKDGVLSLMARTDQTADPSEVSVVLVPGSGEIKVAAPGGQFVLEGPSRSTFIHRVDDGIAKAVNDAPALPNLLEDHPVLAWLDRNAEALRSLAPDGYHDGFDALFRLVHTPEIYETEQTAPTVSEWTVELREGWRPGLRLIVHLRDGQEVPLERESGREGTALSRFRSLPVDLNAIESLEVIYAPDEAKTHAIRRIAKEFGLGDASGAVADLADRLLASLTGAAKDAVEERLASMNAYALKRLRVTARTDPSERLEGRRSHVIVDETLTGDGVELSGDAPSWGPLRAAAIPSLDYDLTETRRYRDYAALERLVEHLRANRMPYLRSLWLQEDPDRRALRLDRYRFAGAPLLQVIENRPVGVMGNLVAFPLSDGSLRGAGDEGSEEYPISHATLDRDLPEFVTPPLEEMRRPPQLISIPTRGVYAETLLSKCNASEKRDVTRRVDPADRCDLQAPEIAGVAPGSRRADATPEAPAPPSATVNIQAPTEAPAPGATSGLLGALTSGSAFRDMSRGAETVGAARALAEQAISESGDAQVTATLEKLKDKLDEAGDASGGGGSGSSSPGGRGPGRSGGDGPPEGGPPMANGASPNQWRGSPASRDTAEEMVDKGRAIRENLSGRQAEQALASYNGVAQPALTEGAGFGERVAAYAEASVWSRMLVHIAKQEEKRWTTTDANGNPTPLKEGAMQARLQDYYEAAGLGKSDAQSFAQAAANNQQPWSAAFVSFCVKQAGVTERNGFDLAVGHDEYVVGALVNRENADLARPFWLYEVDEIDPLPGDILCKNRDAGATYTYDRLKKDFLTSKRVNGRTVWNRVGTVRASLHADIVVKRETVNGVVHIETLGGNTYDYPSGGYDTVGRKRWRLGGPNGPVMVDGQGNQIGGDYAPLAADGSRFGPDSVFGWIRIPFDELLGGNANT